MTLAPSFVFAIGCLCFVVGCSSSRDIPLTDQRLCMMLELDISEGYVSRSLSKVGNSFVPESDSSRHCNGGQIKQLLQALIPFELEREIIVFNPDVMVLYQTGKSPTEFLIQSTGSVIRFKCRGDSRLYRCKSDAKFLKVWAELHSQMSS